MRSIIPTLEITHFFIVFAVCLLVIRYENTLLSALQTLTHLIVKTVPFNYNLIILLSLLLKQFWEVVLLTVIYTWENLVTEGLMTCGSTAIDGKTGIKTQIS